MPLGIGLHFEGTVANYICWFIDVRLWLSFYIIHDELNCHSESHLLVMGK